MRIAQIVCVFPPYFGGIGNSVYNMSAALADLGHEVTIFTPDYKQPDENGLTNPAEAVNKFTVRRLRPVFKIGNAAFLPQLFFKLGGFDVVHLHYPFYGAAEAVIIKKLFSGKKMKLVLHYHMDARARSLKGFIFYLYRRMILPLLARSAKIITCASLDYIKHSDLKKYYRLKTNKFRQTSFGVNLEQFAVKRGGFNQARKNPVILFVGGLDKAHYFKGLDNLIGALAAIRQDPEFSSTVLQVVGKGDLLEYYKKSALNLGLADAVILNDRVSNDRLADFYDNCDCLVLPSINQAEAFGLVLLEAMASGKPVITSNLPGVRSVFKNGRQGLLVKPNDLKDLTEKLRLILGDKPRAERLGLAGRELVEKKYTWEKVAKRLDIIYNYVKFT